MNYSVTFGILYTQRNRVFGFIIYCVLNFCYMAMICKNCNFVVNKLELLYEYVHHRHVQTKIEIMQTLQIILTGFFGLRILCAFIEMHISASNSDSIKLLSIMEEMFLSLIIFTVLFVLRARGLSEFYDAIDIEFIPYLISSKARATVLVLLATYSGVTVCLGPDVIN